MPPGLKKTSLIGDAQALADRVRIWATRKHKKGLKIIAYFIHGHGDQKSTLELYDIRSRSRPEKFTCMGRLA